MADDPVPKDFTLSPQLHHYVLAHSVPVDPVQQDLITRTRELGAISMMQVAPEQGAFMTLLALVIGAETIVEVGTFTGYSTLCLARGLRTGGRVLAFDISEEWTALAHPAWEAAGVADRIDLRIGRALDGLRALPATTVIDLAFIDADKVNYGAYYEEIVTRLRPNGVVLVDNVLWSGRVADPDDHDENTDAIRAFNAMVAADDRVDVVVLPIADGLSVVRKR